MPSPLSSEKLRSLGYVVLGALLIYFGAKTPGPARLLLVVPGVLFVTRHSSRFFALRAAEDRMYRRTGTPLRDELRRASLPRQLFWLLFAVAEVDGQPDAAEREAVRRFLLKRFPDPISQADLASFEAARIPPEQVEALAYDLRRSLSPSERDTVFFWCCLVAFADGRFAKEEHDALQRIARGIGVDSVRARRIFWHAKTQVVAGAGAGAETGAGAGAGAGAGSWSNSRARSGWEQPRNRARGVVGDRARALDILGLPHDATPEQIRSRHRELVKEHHPDAHAHLGPVAAEEATERFREVQAAYELLIR